MSSSRINCATSTIDVSTDTSRGSLVMTSLTVAAMAGLLVSARRLPSRPVRTHARGAETRVGLAGQDAGYGRAHGPTHHSLPDRRRRAGRRNRGLDAGCAGRL